MWFQRSVLLTGLVFAFGCHSSDASGNIPSTLLEESVKLKLKTAAHLQDNLLKIFNHLESTDYELKRSIQQIRKYLKNSGSSIEYIDILPTLGYAPVEKQFKGILSALDEHSPRYLLPAISIVRNAIDVAEILQPDGGPLRVDIFSGISAQDLSKLALPTPFPNETEQHDRRGPWPSYIKKVVTSMSMGFLTRSARLVGLIKKNVLGYDSLEIHEAESMRRSTHNVGRNNEKIEDSKLDSDLDEFLTNVLRSPIETTTESVSSYSNEIAKSKASRSKLAPFFDGDKMNYSLLLNNKQLLKSQSLLSLIESDDTLVKNILGDFPLHEYLTQDDFLTAVVSKLRRYQAEKGTISEVVELTYADLIRNSRYAWGQIPRSARALKSLLYGMKIDPNSTKIRRLANDVEAIIEANVRPEAWLKVVHKVPKINCYDPSCTVLRTLEGVREFRVTQDSVLNKSISDLVQTYNRFYHDGILDSCPSLLSKKAFQVHKTTKVDNRILDVDDLMQAIPGLDVKSQEYINLRDFLCSTDLEKQIGEAIDTEEHPTRGRMLAWLLDRVERLSDVDEGIRNTAGKFVENVAFDGYGAAAVSFRRM